MSQVEKAGKGLPGQGLRLERKLGLAVAGLGGWLGKFPT